MAVVFGALVPQVADIVRVIDAEYEEMPGMRADRCADQAAVEPVRR